MPAYQQPEEFDSDSENENDEMVNAETVLRVCMAFQGINLHLSIEGINADKANAAFLFFGMILFFSMNMYERLRGVEVERLRGVEVERLRAEEMERLRAQSTERVFLANDNSNEHCRRSRQRFPRPQSGRPLLYLAISTSLSRPTVPILKSNTNTFT